MPEPRLKLSKNISEFKPSKWYIIFNAIMMSVLIVTFVLLSSLSNLVLFLITVNIIYITNLFFKRRVTNILLDNLNCILIIEFKTNIKTQSIRLDNLNCRSTFKRNIGSRGILRSTFRIYKDDALIVEITPWIDGWSSKLLKDVSEKINSC